MCISDGCMSVSVCGEVMQVTVVFMWVKLLVWVLPQGPLHSHVNHKNQNETACCTFTTHSADTQWVKDGHNFIGAVLVLLKT